VPRKKKRPADMTTDETLKKLFPKKVVEEMKQTASLSHKSSSPPKDTP
jgi:hypothetical protein